MNARFARTLAVATVAIAHTACLSIPLRRGASPDSDKATRRTIRSAGTPAADTPALGSKRVYGKQPPNRLLAHDGTSCIVSREKFENTAIGTSIWCVWTDLDGVGFHG